MIKNLNATINLILQLVKHCLVEAFGLTIRLGTLSLLLWFNETTAKLFFTLFKTLSSIATTIHGYLWNKHWTFSKNDCLSSVKKFSRFILVISIRIFDLCFGGKFSGYKCRSPVRNVGNYLN